MDDLLELFDKDFSKCNASFDKVRNYEPFSRVLPKHLGLKIGWIKFKAIIYDLRIKICKSLTSHPIYTIVYMKTKNVTQSKKSLLKIILELMIIKFIRLWRLRAYTYRACDIVAENPSVISYFHSHWKQSRKSQVSREVPFRHNSKIIIIFIPSNSLPQTFLSLFLALRILTIGNFKRIYSHTLWQFMEKREQNSLATEVTAKRKEP